MKRKCFTLVELLAVIAIIGILAGILIPALGGAQLRGKITQAKSDMKTIETALESFAADNGGRYCVNSSGEWYTSSCTDSGDSYYLYKTESDTDAASFGIIKELCDPQSISPKDNIKNNMRKIRYLDPSKDYDGGDSAKELWPDPWGLPYNIMICIDGSGKLTPHSSHNVYSNVVLWSNGPDGANEDGTNADSDTHGTRGATADDIASWHK